MLCNVVVYVGLVVSIVLLAVILHKVDRNSSAKVGRVGIRGVRACNPADPQCAGMIACDMRNIACGGLKSCGDPKETGCVENGGGECVSADQSGCASPENEDPDNPNGGGRWSRNAVRRVA
jgi:hypothetical protein